MRDVQPEDNFIRVNRKQVAQREETKVNDWI